MRRDYRHLLYMVPRRQIGSFLWATAVGSVLPTGASASPALATLFTIARSKNANVVRYSARCRQKDLDSGAPIEAHWLMLAEDGRREELSWAERKLAYGFTVSDLSADACRLRLVAFKNRPILVQRRPEGFRALVAIAGRRATLERIFVRTSEGTLFPSVQHVDLYGMSLDGAPLTERILAP
jgi:hypothetical protein